MYFQCELIFPTLTANCNTRYIIPRLYERGPERKQLCIKIGDTVDIADLSNIDGASAKR